MLPAVFGTIGGVAVIAVVFGIIFGKFGGLAATGQSANLLQVGGMNNFDVLAGAEAKKYVVWYSVYLFAYLLPLRIHHSHKIFTLKLLT